MRRVRIELAYAAVPTEDGAPVPMWAAAMYLDGEQRMTAGSQGVDTLLGSIAADLERDVQDAEPRAAMPADFGIGIELMMAVECEPVGEPMRPRQHDATRAEVRRGAKR